MTHPVFPVIPAASFRLERNRRAERGPQSAPDAATALWRQFHDDALSAVQGLRGYRVTPLRALDDVASAARLGAVYYKDESGRFGLGSFKGLGAIYAVLRAVRDASGGVEAARPAGAVPVGRKASPDVTVACATDGNHGRAVAMGARLAGCRCVVYLPAQVSAGREQAIVEFGATTVRLDGNYDDAVEAVEREAARRGWILVPDTSADPAADTPRNVMCGYMTLMREVVDVLGSAPGTLTHVVVQAGVGGLAAAVCAYCWQLWGSARPTLVVVEADRADCLLRSAMAGRPTAVGGEHDTIMAGLACGVPSAAAWPILEYGADFFMAIPDEPVVATMRLLARREDAIVGGESGVAGLAALLLAVGDARAREELGLGASSRVLVIGTEGATDPDVYARLVGDRREP